MSDSETTKNLREQVADAERRAYAVAKSLLRGMVNPSLLNSARFDALEKLVVAHIAGTNSAYEGSFEDKFLSELRDYWEMVIEEMSPSPSPDPIPEDHKKLALTLLTNLQLDQALANPNVAVEDKDMVRAEIERRKAKR